ncbi:MAG: GyrI-like domain-containing protein [Bacteroidetes bacterium]|nr:GyrI-like domain-containing protein [Bacteroidota bacterium]
MKKWLVSLAIVLVLLVVSVYILIPSNLKISKVTSIGCSLNGAYRCLINESRWSHWQPNDATAPIPIALKGKKGFQYKSNHFYLAQVFRNAVEVFIDNQDYKLSSSINLLSERSDSVIADWQCNLPSSWNPIKRIQRYREAVGIKNDMANILDRFKSYVEDKKNVYGIPITMSSINDSFLVSTKYISPVYPSTTDVYKHFDILKQYIAKEKALETGSPMLNVTKLDSNRFQVMVALPINKLVKANGLISPKEMIRGNFIVTEIQGGAYSVNHALEQIQLYFQDYRKTAMAIPFQYLLTDRQKETDSSKWVTRIYAPVLR